MHTVKFRIAAVVMALILLAISIGITSSVHYCSLKLKPATISCAQQDCCHNVEVTSCCELINQKCISGNLSNDEGCCRHEIKSFAFSTAFVHKINSFQTIQCIIFSCHVVSNPDDLSAYQHSFIALNIFPPPRISGTALLKFIQVLNL